MPVNIGVTVTGTSPSTYLKIINDTFETVNKSLASIADATVDHMQTVIKAKTHRLGSTGNLKDSIQAYKLEDGYGVGDIAYMSRVAPYWAIVNYGGFVPLATNGKVLYGSYNGAAPDPSLAGSNPGFGATRFVKGQFPLYPMKPGFPISPKNYIDDTVSWVFSYLEGYNLASPSVMVWK